MVQTEFSYSTIQYTLGMTHENIIQQPLGIFSIWYGSVFE